MSFRYFSISRSTQPGETDHYTCYDHAKAIQNALPNVSLDGIICNNNHEAALSVPVQWVKINEHLLSEFTVFQGDLIDDQHPWRHDPDKLAATVLKAFQSGKAKDK